MGLKNEAEIRKAEFPSDAELVRKIFRDYQENIQVDLCFQSFEEELREMPGRYAGIWIARQGDDALGCVGLRPMGERVGEIKRLFVYPNGRGMGLGRALLERVIDEARRSGLATLRLDTVEEKMGRAIQLYREAGFSETGRREAGGVGLLDMELRLDGD